jgi:phosphatidylethanolamine/phosphatidyl-N-methylethanolamine N-methyltransferase
MKKFVRFDIYFNYLGLGKNFMLLCRKKNLSLGLLLVSLFMVTPSRPGVVSKVAKTTVAISVFVAAYVGAQLACGNSLEDVVMFAKEFYKNPDQMGGFGPCSPYLGEAAVDSIPRKKIGSGPLRILEIGSGTGSVTRQLMKRISSGTVVDLVEMQPDLCEMLKKEFCSEKYKDFTVNVHCKMIQDFKPEYKYDSIVCTVPFNSLPSSIVKEIWQNVLNLLVDGGTVSYVAYCQMDKLAKLKKLFNPERLADYKKNLSFLRDLRELYGAGMKTVYKNVFPINAFYLKFNNPAQIQLS